MGKPKSKVMSVSSFVSISGARRFRLQLDCGHTVARSKVRQFVQCEECP